MHAAFILTSVTIADAEAFATYRAAVAEVNAKLGGDMVVRGAVRAVLEGEAPIGDVIVVIGFADLDEARAYIASREYSALAPLRAKAGRFVIRLVG
jgi:uncharacterized protein (DUF1330 family)